MTRYLFEIDENLIPDSAHADFFESRDKKRLRYAVFRSEAVVRNGTVVILHGRNECIEKYFETVRDLSDRGFATATFDWRGQGGSDRLTTDPSRGYVDSFYDYVADLETFFETIVLPDCPGPYYLLGHSTGSLVALLASPMLTNRVERMVLCAPLLELRAPQVPMPAIRIVSSVMNNIGFGRLYMSGGRRPFEVRPFEGNRLTTDIKRYARNAALYNRYPQLALGGPTISWVSAFCQASGIVTEPEFVSAIRIPVLFVAAGADMVVCNNATERYARRLRAGSLITIDGARHEILQEADRYREQFFAAFDAFVPGGGKV